MTVLGKEIEMKTTHTVSLALGALMVAFTATAASADEVGRVKVPFPFMVNGVSLPAGEYDVRTADISPAIVIIESRDNPRERAMFNTVVDTDHERDGQPPSLTFVKHEGQYELSVIREGGESGREVIVR